ncbi:uncharacterized protein PV07_08703 [Cladophialophora immunda]|uniref:Cupin type-1 domain-containing protein n=1 Tax=Cladophialophora immunda TaxID=569365 RepID=A0A0D2AKQ5_9EURO|nr:uncharacterized protein PV07_08703 [Cladophialophora immunda]KIW25537.1 hypothetical protein PV07_08703 [Cladophialophora immunda]
MSGHCTCHVVIGNRGDSTSRSALDSPKDDHALYNAHSHRTTDHTVAEVKAYHLPPTAKIPNSPYPLLHYRNALPGGKERNMQLAFYDRFVKNGWSVQWMTRYGKTQSSRYHSSAYECMAVLNSTTIIRFGVADTFDDLEENTNGLGKEDGGADLKAKPGDVFVNPAGVSHKTYNTPPLEEFKLLTPGDTHRITAEDERATIEEVKVSGFCIIGCYPNGSVWDWAFGGDSEGNYETVWAVPKPEKDPIFSTTSEGLVGLWK